MVDFFPQERRRHPRAYVPAVASLEVDGAPVGKCLVRNLSAGGLLLLGAPALDAGTRCQVLLQAPGVGALKLQGEAVRTRATEGEAVLGVRLLDVAPEVAARLEHAVEEAFQNRFGPSTLVMDGDVSTLVDLAEGLGRLGRRALLALTPLEAVRWLCDLETHVEIAMVSGTLTDAGDVTGHGGDLLAFIGEEFPGIHRVLVHQRLPDEETFARLGENAAHAHLVRPFTLEALATVLITAPPSQVPPLRRVG